MDRLTAREPKQNLGYLVKVKPDEQEVDSKYPNTLRAIFEAMQRLAEYEDTGLTPEEIKELKVKVGKYKEQDRKREQDRITKERWKMQQRDGSYPSFNSFD